MSAGTSWHSLGKRNIIIFNVYCQHLELQEWLENLKSILILELGFELHMEKKHTYIACPPLREMKKNIISRLSFNILKEELFCKMHFHFLKTS